MFEVLVCFRMLPRINMINHHSPSSCIHSEWPIMIDDDSADSNHLINRRQHSNDDLPAFSDVSQPFPRLFPGSAAILRAARSVDVSFESVTKTWSGYLIPFQGNHQSTHYLREHSCCSGSLLRTRLKGQHCPYFLPDLPRLRICGVHRLRGIEMVYDTDGKTYSVEVAGVWQALEVDLERPLYSTDLQVVQLAIFIIILATQGDQVLNTFARMPVLESTRLLLGSATRATELARAAARATKARPGTNKSAFDDNQVALGRISDLSLRFHRAILSLGLEAQLLQAAGINLTEFP